MEGVSASLLHSTVPYLNHPFILQPERRGSTCVRGELCCTEKARNMPGENVAEQHVGETSGINKNDKFKKGEIKNEDSAAESPSSAVAPHWKILPASVSHD